MTPRFFKLLSLGISDKFVFNQQSDEIAKALFYVALVTKILNTRRVEAGWRCRYTCNDLQAGRFGSVRNALREEILFC
jgi:hypothetical protein